MSDPVFEPIGQIRSRVLVLPQDDIDTDQILPARFMTTTERTGLGSALFYDWRHGPDGATGHPLNRIEPASHRILVAGRNFGSGSSREHAPWALVDYGFRVVIAPSIADIFRGNAIQNGLLPISVPEDVCAALATADGDVIVDLRIGRIDLPPRGPTFTFAIELFARHCLLEGRDPLGWILDRQELITQYERERAA